MDSVCSHTNVSAFHSFTDLSADAVMKCEMSGLNPIDGVYAHRVSIRHIHRSQACLAIIHSYLNSLEGF